MPSFNTAFKAEVTRLTRKEIRNQVGATMKASAQLRRNLRELKKENSALQKRLSVLERGEKKRQGPRPTPTEAPTGVRFSPKQLKAHRKRLGISAANYADLVGVSPLTIYNWESGKSHPRASKLAAWATIRNLGVREAQHLLDEMDE